MTINPKISVLMAVYNGERYLEEALTSVLNQTFGDFEFLIVDDGSTDQTPRILVSLADTRVRVVRHDRVGLTRSLNQGLSLARGEYVARQDADDLSLADRLKKQVAYLDSHSEVVLVGSGMTLITENRHPLRDYMYPSEHDLLTAELERLVSPLPHSTIMFRRTPILNSGGYREIFEKAQDYDLYLRVIENHRIASIPESLCCLRHSLNSVTFEDGEGQQFQYAVLALITSVVRRERGIDPLNLPGQREFLARFQAWYASSRYPRIFRSRQFRRQTRIALSKGQFTEAIQCLIAATLAEPAWLINRWGIRQAGAETFDAVRWAQDALDGIR